MKFFLTHCIPDRKKLNHRLSKLAAILRSMGHEVRISRLPANVGDADEIVIFNGSLGRQRSAARTWREQGRNISFVEVGYFPQRGQMILGRHGTFGRNLFLNEEIPENTPEDEAYLESFFDRYTNGRYSPRPESYVLVMLQRQCDATIRQHCHPSFRKMNSLTKYVESLYPGERVRVRRHPKEISRKVWLGEHSEMVPKDEWLFDSIAGASAVVGINSTSLFEAALAGKDVIALGECPLKDHAVSQRAVVREILRRQIPNGGCEDVRERISRSVGRDW